jgi:hypothetical protein
MVRSEDNDEVERIWKEAVEALPGICVETLERTIRASVRIDDVAAEVRTEHLLKRNLKLCRYAISTDGIQNVLSLIGRQIRQLKNHKFR